MNTLAYIKYKEPKRNWKYASIVLEGKFNNEQEIDEFIQGDIIGDFIYWNSYCGALDNWEVYDFIEIDSEPTNKLIPSYKSEKLKTIEKIEKETILLNKKTEKIKKDNEKIESQIKKLHEENINGYIEHFQITRDEAEFFSANFENYVKRYFKPNGVVIKQDYQEYLKGNLEIETKNRNKPQIEISEEIEQSEFSGDYVTLLNKKISAYLFIDYLKHISTVSYKSFNTNDDFKKSKESNYENIRCELHQKIFSALGGDRIDRENEIGNSIDSFLSKITLCACGGRSDMLGDCVDCGRRITFSDYKYNLNLYINK